MHESNSRHVSVVSVLICWPQTVQSINGQEVVSYKESVCMQASDAKACNFNFPTFKVTVHLQTDHLKFLTSLILDLTLKIGYKLSIATSLAVSQTTVMPLIFSIWSEMSDRVAHYQAHSSSLVLKSLHLRLKKSAN